MSVLERKRTDLEVLACSSFNRLTRPMSRESCTECSVSEACRLCLVFNVWCRLFHGLCPPPVSRAVSTACFTGCVLLLFHGPCPPPVSRAVSTACFTGRVHLLFHGPCPPSRVKTAIKATKTPPFADAVGHSRRQAKHAVCLLS
jgi:hypothetical protein